MNSITPDHVNQEIDRMVESKEKVTYGAPK
jgi:hypothetical protein